ncbi:hypothetical protein PHYPSEUDO_008308 [Phytophthora pseudosyringae]|uniref:Armadillo repeat-containing domain-containing protein n=1 Tax=Phytophthora pseudosyringae TaxID=221518 RepID=A0A8T1VHQ3_9STRA|nr:hypothetical protein PHYPSEUDO_008308 [Phytophthora pseudosyringae]
MVAAVADARNQWAVYALWALSLNNESNCIVISKEGATPPLVSHLRWGARAQKQWAAYALACIAQNNDLNRVAIVEEGGIAPLEALVLSGTDDQKAQAVRALKILVSAHSEASTVVVPR